MKKKKTKPHCISGVKGSSWLFLFSFILFLCYILKELVLCDANVCVDVQFNLQKRNMFGLILLF
jgi:hypothetical protein